MNVLIIPTVVLLKENLNGQGTVYGNFFDFGLAKN